ncbi:hypothetical protein J2785_006737 [Burkholderia ambifaria]|nr:hypothetical protein [Burkholderia ambifaria]MDR6503544.1 hypothetical protein [Burkholderia ambifaria]
MAEENRSEDTQVNGIDHRLFDGYDGAVSAPRTDYIAQLLAAAPEAMRARVAEFAKERATAKQ